ncbi:carbohydrate esterase family 9 protein [Rhodotorula diobovata]|uniref:Carbohydrate esterase family 9 protein n=1 Tax=Rhodotorula diobovata TaxID=5288 RepID=A0A5C5FRX6_9BASI|nr:carbohydrate esterase family 9 protein [Rhodotorula diobovata]
MKGLASSSDDEEKVKRTAGVRLRRNRSFADREARPHHYTSRRISLALLAVAAGCALIALYQSQSTKDGPALASRSLASLSEDERTAWSEVVDRCEDLHTPPGVPESFWQRRENDRFAAGTSPTLIRNATVWTGEDDGKQVLYNHDVLLDRGLVVKIGEDIMLDKGDSRTKVVQAHGSWLTPGIFDMHSHIGVDSLPALSGASDTNSVAGAVLPHLRSLDGINGHDLAFRRVVSGGVTTSLILPGSANNVGGQAFVIKLRPTAERTIDSLVLEMPWNVKLPSGERRKRGDPPRWRHMKNACGENIRRVYGQTRLDLAWNWRSNLDKARSLKQKQDKFCSRALAAAQSGRALVDQSGEQENFPDDLQLEALVDVLRGKVKVNTHCYETTDLDGYIRLTHEFQFPVAVFHHAHETYLVPDLLKQAWPGNGTATPAVALFATNGRYKREAWRGSEYAAKILNEQNISVIFKSDHPVTDSRYLLYQAQQGHDFGLPANKALASITTVPAVTAGLSHRIGFLRRNYDADVVLWSSHPLSLGATPQQVWIDGVAQLAESFPPASPGEDETARRNGPPQASLREDYDPTREQEDDGFDWLNPGETEHRKKPELVERVKFTNVGEVLLKDGKQSGLASLAQAEGVRAPFEVVVDDGKIVCLSESCGTALGVKTVDLKNGSLLPSLVTFGSALGLTDIIAEKSTTDAPAFDPLLDGKLSFAQQQYGPRVSVRALDGLSLGGKQLKTAEENGVGKAITAPLGKGFFRGVSVAFRTGAAHVLEKGALVKEAAALHVAVGHFGSAAPVAIEVAELRALLLGGVTAPKDDDGHEWAPVDHFAEVAKGKLPLVVRAHKADVIASLIRLKEEVEHAGGTTQRWVIHGGQEAHLLASELAASRIGVILSPPRSFPATWDERRSLPGPPLTPDTAQTVLHRAGVVVALGSEEEWMPRSVVQEAAWAQRLSRGEVSRRDAVAWVSTNLVELFGLDDEREEDAKVDFAAFERDPFEFGSRVVAVSSGSRVKLFP